MESFSEVFIQKLMKSIEDQNNKILEKLGKLEERMSNLEWKVENVIQEKSDYYNSETLKELKSENIELDRKDVLKALKYRDYRSAVCIFRLYYKNKEAEKYMFPIRITSKRKFEYYENNKWNPDLYGYHITHILCRNIQNLFMKFNDMDNGDISLDDFFLNQQFINKLSDEKYKKDIFKNIIEEIKINSI